MGAADRTTILPNIKKMKLLLRPKAAYNTTSQLQRQIKRKKKQKKTKIHKN